MCKFTELPVGIREKIVTISIISPVWLNSTYFWLDLNFDFTYDSNKNIIYGFMVFK